ncbi:DNA polymerase IV [Veillonella magna]|uniref:DNA polymerase IV n=1 Tax=Veillonella magna TaxID=464322 RepID=A0ABS2GDT7_9FIRM|nr:DNA polymerase IV [Veillonella magna]MBM6824031.1 DNA polymerase IV [Veillonella magna]MBM6912324.1 DNA polymerase IV [Veillonella magna]
MRRWIMHVDMDAFYASVEQRDHPEYKGRPVIVGGLSLRGVVATASYEARRYGVHSAMSMAKARELCPEGIFLRPRFYHYRAISEQIHRIMERYSPYIEPLSLDEAFLDVTGAGAQFASPYAMARQFKDDVLAATGLVVSVGVAPNKFLAKLASDIRKPDGLVIVPHGKEAAMIAPLPVRRLWGVGKRTAQALEKAGFHTIGDIAALKDERPLLSICGSMGRRMYEMAQGIDHRPVEYNREIQSVGNEETYETDLVDEARIDLEWRYFAHYVAERLRRKRLRGHTVAIKVRYANFSTVTRQTRLDHATDSENVLYRVSRMLYNRLNNTMPVRLLGVTVSGLEKAVVQPSLFEEDRAEEKLATTLDELTKKYGTEVVMKGALWQRSVACRKDGKLDERDDTF